MKIIRTIFCFTMVLLSALTALAQDPQILAGCDWVGTARYTAMAGAMTAVGGDAAAAMDNPAGLGVYRKFEMQASLGFQYDQTAFDSQLSGSRMRVIPTMATIVFHLPNYKSNALLHHNLLVGYRRMNNVRRYYGGTVDGLYYESDQAGSTNAYNFSWGTSLRDKLFLGLGLQADYVAYSKIVVKNDGALLSTDQHVSNSMYGWGFAASAGVLYHPIRPLRLGVSITSPAVGQLYQRKYVYRYYNSETVEDINDKYSERMYLPMRLNVGVAFQCLNYGLLSMEYNWAHLREIDDVHTFKVGMEGVIRNRFFLNVGYAYESTFQNAPVRYYSDVDKSYNDDFRYTLHSHYVGAGLGYQTRNLMLRLGYRYRLQREDIYPFARESQVRNLNATTHNVILTLAFTK